MALKKGAPRTNACQSHMRFGDIVHHTCAFWVLAYVRTIPCHVGTRTLYSVLCTRAASIDAGEAQVLAALLHVAWGMGSVVHR